MTAGPCRALAVAAALLLMSAGDARADWLVSPFIGVTFGGQTVLWDPEQGAESAHLMLGGAGGWLSDGIFGVEGEFAWAPRYFERDDRASLVTSSYLWTLSGNVIAALPLSVTRESLRPYLTGGLGVMDGRVQVLAPNVLPELLELQDRPSAAVNFGGGVIGFVTENAGARFDLRYVRSLAREVNPFTGALRTKLSFWRATAGVTLRY